MAAPSDRDCARVTPSRIPRPLETFYLRHNPAGRAQAQGARRSSTARGGSASRSSGRSSRVSLKVHDGEALGLVGRNGSGKSTFLKVIAGIHQPTSGDLLVARGTRIGSMIELGTGFHPELTGQENVLLNTSIHGLSRAEALERLRRRRGLLRPAAFHGRAAQELLVGHDDAAGVRHRREHRPRRPAARRDFRRRRRGLPAPVHGDAQVVPGARQDDPVRVALVGGRAGGLPPRGASSITGGCCTMAAWTPA